VERLIPSSSAAAAFRPLCLASAASIRSRSASASVSVGVPGGRAPRRSRARYAADATPQDEPVVFESDEVVKLAPRLSVRPVQHSGTALVPRLRTVKCDELRILGKPWLGAQTPTASAHRLDALAE
jgi:hypothetical protein